LACPFVLCDRRAFILLLPLLMEFREASKENGQELYNPFPQKEIFINKKLEDCKNGLS